MSHQSQKPENKCKLKALKTDPPKNKHPPNDTGKSRRDEGTLAKYKLFSAVVYWCRD
jgi:hypothetical protein